MFREKEGLTSSKGGETYRGRGLGCGCGMDLGRGLRLLRLKEVCDETCIMLALSLVLIFFDVNLKVLTMSKRPQQAGR